MEIDNSQQPIKEQMLVLAQNKNSGFQRVSPHTSPTKNSLRQKFLPQSSFNKPCNVCHYKFNSQTVLDEHILLKHSENNYTMNKRLCTFYEQLYTP